MIYEPAEDSYLIEKEVRKLARGKRVLDVGCGSGILMKAAKVSRAKSVAGVDIDDQSVGDCAQMGLDVIKSDLFERVEGKFDLIVFNPPYLPEDEREDVESARITSGGENGDEIILRFLDEVRVHLSDEGEILLLVSSLTPHSLIERKLLRLGLSKRVLADAKVFMEVLEVWGIRGK